MKKLFWMLAAVLPMVLFTACGDDDEPEVDNSYTLPVLTFDSSVDAVKAAVKAQPLDLMLVDEDEYEDEDTPGLTWNELYYASSMEMNYPWYTYIFANNQLMASAMTVSNDNAAGLNKWLTQWYYQYGETEDGFVYRNNKDEKKATIWAELEIDDEDTSIYFTNMKPTADKAGIYTFTTPAMVQAKKAVAARRNK